MRCVLVVALTLSVARSLFAATLVLCPASLAPELEDWLTLRRGQGQRVTVRQPAPTVEGNRRLIGETADAEDLRCVLIVGDSDYPDAAPCDSRPLSIISRWGPEQAVATDHTYGDLYGDSAPELAVGRIPCNSSAELRQYLQRVIAYENRHTPPVEIQRMSVVASPARFSPWLDRIIETTAMRALTTLTPGWVELDAVYASPGSPHCPPLDEAASSVVETLTRPSLAWVYLGHGLRRSLDHVPTSFGPQPLLDVAAIDRLAAHGPNGPIVAAMLACYTGDFTDGQDCLAERMLAHRRGPLAVIAATRVTMPYGNGVLGGELLKELFTKTASGPPVIGEVVRRAKVSTLASAPAASSGSLRAALEAIAAGVSTEDDRQQERLEHVYAYQLLGDPLLTVPLPLAAESSKRVATLTEVREQKNGPPAEGRRAVAR